MYLSPKKSGGCSAGRPQEGPHPEIADIFNKHGEEYRCTHDLSKKQRQVMLDIEHCRTSELGYHVDICSNAACKHTEHAYNSCRNRHCPKCQGIARRKWIQARISDLLPTSYYHVVFTLPHKIQPVSQYNSEAIYNLLFKAASETLLQFGRDPKHLGAEIGFFGILHTWGGKLWQHDHLHFIVLGGGLSPEDLWVETKCKGKFLFPVCALSQVFRGKFIEGLKGLYAADNLVIPPTMKHLNDPKQFEKWLNILVGRNWVVYAKRPFPTPEKVVEYIGRYTHKVAISNSRLLSIADGLVRFRFKNYRNNGRLEETVLSAEEFIRRFLLHVLPAGFHRIRHYGILANGRCKAMVEKVRSLISDPTAVSKTTPKVPESIPCPMCGQGVMLPIYVVHRFGTMILRPWWMWGADATPG